MKQFLTVLSGIILLASCVPAKKYNELLEKERACNDELVKFKASALDSEGALSELKTEYAIASKQLTSLQIDTTNMGQEHRVLLARFNKLAAMNEALETNYNKLRLSGASETAALTKQLEMKKIELQLREDELTDLGERLRIKQTELEDREARVKELEEIIKAKDETVAALKQKVTEALKGFEDKGLTVTERNGKIYVSLEAQLLFASGSTAIQQDGKTALIDLAKVLENEPDLEIIVEGHTDTDQMRGTQHPRNNWELSVLRSTAVVEIMTANSAINPAQLMAAGRSEFDPVDPANKVKNRRIEIIISPNLNALYELISND